MAKKKTIQKAAAVEPEAASIEKDDPESEVATEREQRFCELLVLHGNRARAAYESGYGSCTRTSRYAARDLLKRPRVMAYLQLVRDEWKEEIGVTTERVLKELAAIGLADIRKLYKEDGSLKLPNEWPDDIAAAVSSIEIDEIFTRGRDRELIGYTKSVKLWNKIDALTAKAKHLNLFTEKPEDTGKGTPAETGVSVTLNIPDNGRSAKK